MPTALIALLIILALFGGGFALDVLWFVAAAMLALWAIGFVARGADQTWYRW